MDIGLHQKINNYNLIWLINVLNKNKLTAFYF